MATQRINAPLVFQASINQDKNVWQKYLAYVDSQSSNSMTWWLASLMIHGCLLVPVTFLVVYSLNGPSMTFLFISLICFFINIVANMGGAGFRFTFNTFMFSIGVHIAMVLATLGIAGI